MNESRVRHERHGCVQLSHRYSLFGQQRKKLTGFADEPVPTKVRNAFALACPLRPYFQWMTRVYVATSTLHHVRGQLQCQSPEIDGSRCRTVESGIVVGERFGSWQNTIGHLRKGRRPRKQLSQRSIVILELRKRARGNDHRRKAGSLTRTKQWRRKRKPRCVPGLRVNRPDRNVLCRKCREYYNE
jgi:hypothetical protein